MFKKIAFTSLSIGLVAVLLAGVVSQTQAMTTSALENVARGRGGQGQVQSGRGSGAAVALPADPAGLTEAERQGLLYMREEEKLARDVYTALAAEWGTSVFQSITRSEQAHMDALKTLLDRYGLVDPAQAEPGVFTDPTLQALYTELVARGRQSLAEALKVGAAIEEIDIADLDERLTQTDNADLQAVYANLRRGSENHLRAFANTLQNQTGETYAPQFLSADAYQAITAASLGGNGQGRGSAGGGYRGGQQP